MHITYYRGQYQVSTIPQQEYEWIGYFHTLWGPMIREALAIPVLAIPEFASLLSVRPKSAK